MMLNENVLKEAVKEVTRILGYTIEKVPTSKNKNMLQKLIKSYQILLDNTNIILDGEKRIKNHYKHFGYEKSHYLKDILEDIFKTKFTLDGEWNESNIT